MGISNMSATIPGFVVPLFVGVVTHGSPGIGPWHVTFYATAAILLLEFVVFTALGSGVEQPWNRPQRKAEDDAEAEEKQALNA
jgi:ACS family sodium-dependent inorganic phosphate cotransporter